MHTHTFVLWKRSFSRIQILEGSTHDLITALMYTRLNEMTLFPFMRTKINKKSSEAYYLLAPELKAV